MAKTKILSDYSSYANYFNPTEMWDKIAKVAKKAGAKTIYGILLLYYASLNSSVSWSDKIKIYGALGYFILPLDLVPDALPVVGYGDDMAAILLVIKSICDNISPETHRKALNKLTEWFGDVDESIIQSLHTEVGIEIQDDYSNYSDDSEYREDEDYSDVEYNDYNLDYSEKQYIEDVISILNEDGELTEGARQALRNLRESYGISEFRAAELEQIAKNNQI